MRSLKDVVIVTLTVALVFFLMNLVFGGCTVRHLPPPDASGDCSSAASALTVLGGCGVDLSRFEQDCRDAERAEAQIGLRYPVGCLSSATTCEAARACR